MLCRCGDKARRHAWLPCQAERENKPRTSFDFLTPAPLHLPWPRPGRGWRAASYSADTSTTKPYHISRAPMILAIHVSPGGRNLQPKAACPRQGLFCCDLAFLLQQHLKAGWPADDRTMASFPCFMNGDLPKSSAPLLSRHCWESGRPASS